MISYDSWWYPMIGKGANKWILPSSLYFAASQHSQQHDGTNRNSHHPNHCLWWELHKQHTPHPVRTISWHTNSSCIQNPLIHVRVLGCIQWQKRCTVITTGPLDTCKSSWLHIYNDRNTALQSQLDPLIHIRALRLVGIQWLHKIIGRNTAVQSHLYRWVSPTISSGWGLLGVYY